MRQDLKHRLVTWKNDLHSGEIKKVFVSNSPVKNGEYIIKLEKSLSNTLAGKINQVKVSNKFLTSAQQDGEKDPSTDMYHLNRVIDSLEREFNDRYDQAINETFKDELVQFAELS